MKIKDVIEKLEKALNKYGNVDVTVSETLWLYNTVKTIRYIKDPYPDSDEGVVELVDYESKGYDWYDIL